MYNVELLPAASADIDEAWAYLVGRSPRAADRLVDELTAGITLISEYPLWFPLHGLSVRKLLVHPYLIFYVVAVNRVTVLRVIHGARDLSVLHLDW